MEQAYPVQQTSCQKPEILKTIKNQILPYKEELCCYQSNIMQLTGD